MKITGLKLEINEGEFTSEILKLSYYIHWNRNLNIKTWVMYEVYWNNGKIYRYSEDYCLFCGNVIGESTHKKRLGRKIK